MKRCIRRREAKASDVGGNKMDFDFCQLLYTAIADIYRFWLKPGQPFQDKWRPRGHVQAAPTDREVVLIIACVARKEFALVNVIQVEKANIPVFSTQEPGS
jgi:hypothetical protein